MNNSNGELRIIIAGSRTFNDYSFLADKLNVVISEFDGFEHQQIKFISGMARGADTLGERYANSNKYEVVRLPADWNTYGKRAGYRRNAEMAKYAVEEKCGVLVAFWDGKSRGTKHMIELARNYGLKVYVYEYAE